MRLAWTRLDVARDGEAVGWASRTQPSGRAVSHRANPTRSGALLPLDREIESFRRRCGGLGLGVQRCRISLRRSRRTLLVVRFLWWWRTRLTFIGALLQLQKLLQIAKRAQRSLTLLHFIGQFPVGQRLGLGRDGWRRSTRSRCGLPGSTMRWTAWPSSGSSPLARRTRLS